MKPRHIVIRDAIVVLVFAAVCVALGIVFDLVDRFHRQTRSWEHLEIDEVIFILPLSLAVGLLWFAWRRLRDYRREINERRHVERALSESEDLYRTLVDTTPDSIVLTDMGGNILAANSTCIVKHGYDSLRDMLSRVENVLGLYVFEEGERLTNQCVSVFQTGVVENIVYNMKKKDGSVFPGELSMAVFWDQDGNPKGFVGVGRDITERRQAEEELGRHREHLEELVHERTVQLESANRHLEEEINERRRIEAEREKLIVELQDALVKVKTLSGLIPICSSCKKIRDDQGYWHQLEIYLKEHSYAEFSHGLCQECMAKLYPEEYKQILKENPELFPKK